MTSISSGVRGGFRGLGWGGAGANTKHEIKEANGKQMHNPLSPAVSHSECRSMPGTRSNAPGGR